MKNGLLCFKCLLSFHQSHLNHCIPLIDFIKLMKENANSIKINTLGQDNAALSELVEDQNARLLKGREEIVQLKEQILVEMDRYL